MLIIGGYVIDLRRSHKREKKKRELHYAKVDCIIHAFRSVNHGIGTEFGAAYDKRFEEMKNENDFIEK